MIEEGELIGHGAQAKCYKILSEDKQKHIVIKYRLPKKYRHPKLDERINTARVKSEAKILQKVLKIGIKVPKVLSVLPKENKILMDYIEGSKLKTYINENEDAVESILKQLGQIILKLHSANIIHGDLTTSNMIIQPQGNDKQDIIYLLDFGLGALTATIQDKAVDLYLFQKAFVATHPKLEDKFSIVQKQYAEKAVLERLEKVRQRGRKKVAFG